MKVDFPGTGTGSDFARAMAIQSDGKIVLAGTTGSGGNTDDKIALLRLNPNGSLDNSFDGDGRVVQPVLAPSDVDINAVAISPVDGKIIVVGQYKASSASTYDWLVARFNPNGSIDNTFSGDGVFTLDGGFGFTDTLYAVTVQNDGQIVTVGVATQGTSNLATLRINDNGTLDSSFNGTGMSIVDFFGGVDFASDVIVQGDDGKIVVAGGSVPAGSYRRFVVLRYNANGTPDTSFNGTGGDTVDFGVSAFGRQVLRQPDGKYVIGGLIGASSPQNYAVARLNANGGLDSSFGTNASLHGTTIINSIAGSTFSNYGIARQSDGAILLGGPTTDASSNSFAAVVRLTSAGVPDSTFNGTGVRTYTMPGTPSGQTNGSDVAFTSDGKIVVAGYTFGATVDFVAMELQSGVDLTPPTVTSGEFHYQTRQEVEIKFSEDVATTVDFNDLQLVRLGTPNQTVSPLFQNLTGGSGTPTQVQWVYGTSASGLLPDGNYRATLPAGSVSDAAGNPLASPFVLDFFVLAGDANRDRMVDVTDLGVLATNWQGSGKTFSQGDFNLDGVVNVTDLGILATNWQKSLPAPASAATMFAAPAISAAPLKHDRVESSESLASVID